MIVVVVVVAVEAAWAYEDEDVEEALGVAAVHIAAVYLWGMAT